MQYAKAMKFWSSCHNYNDTSHIIMQHHATSLGIKRKWFNVLFKVKAYELWVLYVNIKYSFVDWLVLMGRKWTVKLETRKEKEGGKEEEENSVKLWFFITLRYQYCIPKSSLRMRSSSISAARSGRNEKCFKYFFSKPTPFFYEVNICLICKGKIMAVFLFCTCKVMLMEWFCSSFHGLDETSFFSFHFPFKQFTTQSMTNILTLYISWTVVPSLDVCW